MKPEARITLWVVAAAFVASLPFTLTSAAAQMMNERNSITAGVLVLWAAASLFIALWIVRRLLKAVKEGFKS